jgi:HSP20 family protein
MYFPSTHEFFSNPFGAMRRMQDQMDRMFAEALSGSGGGAGQGRRGWAPAVDVTERQGNLIVHAELPGIRPENVQLEVANDTLVISGSRERSEEHEEQGIHRRERMYGSFYREIPLPEGVNADQARAKYNNGVLEITIPMPQQQSRSRRIEIGTGSEESGSGSKKT